MRELLAYDCIVGYWCWTLRLNLLRLALSFNLPRRFRVAEFRAVQVKHPYDLTVLHFHFAQIVQSGIPKTDLAKHFRRGARDQNVPRIATVHYSLSDIDTASGYIAVRIDIGDAIDRAGVNSHSQPEAGTPFLESLTHFQRASRRRFQVAKKNQRHSVACRQRDELLAPPGSNECKAAGNSLLELTQDFPLVIHRQLREAHDVKEQNVSHLKCNPFIFHLRHKSFAGAPVRPHQSFSSQLDRVGGTNPREPVIYDPTEAFRAYVS